MGKISRTEHSTNYSNARQISKDMGETKDCAVVAVSLFAEVSYEEAHRILKAAGRQDKQGTPPHVTKDALRSMGIYANDLSRAQVRIIINSFPGVHKNLKNVTTHHPRRFPGSFVGAPKLLFSSISHICCFREGGIEDWSINNALRLVNIAYDSRDELQVMAWLRNLEALNH